MLIIETGWFNKLPLNVQNLYFKLREKADNGGFVVSNERLINSEGFEALIENKLVVLFNDWIYVVSDLRLNTYLKEIDNPTITMEKPEKDAEKIEEIINYLNERTGSNYKAQTNATRVFIRARLKEGFSVEDFKTVIDKKSNEWLATEQEKYLRPQTLFGTKFESYLNQKDCKPTNAIDYLLAKEMEND